MCKRTGLGLPALRVGHAYKRAHLCDLTPCLHQNTAVRAVLPEDAAVGDTLEESASLAREASRPQGCKQVLGAQDSSCGPGMDNSSHLLITTPDHKSSHLLVTIPDPKSSHLLVKTPDHRSSHLLVTISN